MTPPAVRLADCPVGRPLERHALLAAEGDDGVQGGAGALQPPVGEDSRRAAVDLWSKTGVNRPVIGTLSGPFRFLPTFAMGLFSRPLFVPLAPPNGVADEHVAVVALVGDERVVADGRVHRSAVERVARHVALDSWIESSPMISESTENCSVFCGLLTNTFR